MRVAKTFLIAVGVALVVALTSAVLFERVPPASFGVKQSLWGGGVDQHAYQTGFHLGITGIHKWHILDRRTHFITFSDGGRNTSVGRHLPPLELRTKDNNTATFDITITYRIVPEEAHLLVEEGKKDVYQDRVISTVESVLREELAEMASEEIYSTEERLARAEAALPLLTEALQEFHVKPDVILIRAVRFPAGYEQRLQDKQLTYQQKVLAESQKLLEEQKGLTETFAAGIEAEEKEKRGEWDKQLQELRSANEVKLAEIRAKADLYDQSLRAAADADYETAIADGNLAIAKAEALRNELRNKALDTLGGRIYLAQQAAENLQFESVTLNSNDPSIPSIIDVDEMVRMLVGERD